MNSTPTQSMLIVAEHSPAGCPSPFGCLSPWSARNIQGCRGSALLVTLLVVSLLMILVLALTAVVRMELRQVRIRQDMTLARANARLGANLALARLQETLGPDMRVSARAEILSDTHPDNPDNGVNPFTTAEGTRFWTGAWSSEDWDPGDPGDRQGRFLRWLVSLPDDSQGEQLESVRPGDLNLNSDDFLTLANIRVAPVGGGVPVLAPIRAGLQSVETGGFAWWVSDEGVKANLSLEDPTRGQAQGNIVEDIPRFLFPHRENFAATEWFENTDFDLDTLITTLRKAASLPASSALAFAGPGISLSPEAESALMQDDLFADYTHYTHGVLSSTRRGGMRGDLSLAFWRDRDQITTFDPSSPFTNMAFENDFRRRRPFHFQDYPATQSIRSPSATDKRFFGPRWEVFRDYHNSFQYMVSPETQNARVIPISIGANHYLPIYRNSRGGGGSIWYEQATGDHLDTRAPEAPDSEYVDGTYIPEPVTSPITPILLRVNIQFEMATIAKTDSAGNPVVDGDGNPLYQPELRMTPTVTLWNPYNVAISYEALDGTLLPGGSLTWEHHNSGIQMDFTIDGVPFTLLRANRIFNRFAIRMVFNRSAGELNHLAPGEIRVLTLGESVNADTLGMNVGVDLRSIFPEGPDDTYMSSSESLEGIEKRFGETLEITTEVGFNEGVRLSLFPGTTNPNQNYTHRARIAMTDAFPLETTSLTVDGLNSVLLGYMELNLLPGSPDATPVYNPRRFANFNVRSIFPKKFIQNYTGQVPNYWIGFLSSAAEIQKVGVPTGLGTIMRGFWGPEAGAGGEQFISLFDVPRRPPESIGQYQHAHLSNLYPHLPTYPLGNSLADPQVRRPYAIDTVLNRTFMDISWLLNDSIWDEYFLSTIDPYDIDGLNPPRLSPLRDRFVELDNTVVYDETGTNPNQIDYRGVAENLLLKGAFNINSTSVEAWVSVLSALSGEGIRYVEPFTNTLNTSSDLRFPFYRSTVPLGPENTAWTGGPRDLSRSQIRTMAENMVEEVKRRGPFLSLSDFINRRLSDDDRGLKGAVQTVIDLDAASLQTVVSDLETASLVDASVPAHAAGRPLDMAPGHLSQADVLTAIGPMISARSDTFIIRGYGHTVTNTVGTVQAEAWCEMLVQRIPREKDVARFGRAFQILQFRYLNRDDL